MHSQIWGLKRRRDAEGSGAFAPWLGAAYAVLLGVSLQALRENFGGVFSPWFGHHLCKGCSSTLITSAVQTPCGHQKILVPQPGWDRGNNEVNGSCGGFLFSPCYI